MSVTLPPSDKEEIAEMLRRHEVEKANAMTSGKFERFYPVLDDQGKCMGYYSKCDSIADCALSMECHDLEEFLAEVNQTIPPTEEKTCEDDIASALDRLTDTISGCANNIASLLMQRR
jgi:hypothetical protein